MVVNSFLLCDIVSVSIISQTYALDGEQQEEKSGKNQSNAEECDLHQRYSTWLYIVAALYIWI